MDNVTRASGLAIAGLALAALTAVPATAQETGSFTLTQAGNQIGTESFTRSQELLETELEVIGQGVIATVGTLGDGATLDRVELRILPPGSPDAEPLQSVAAEFRDGTVYVEQPIGTEAGSTEAESGTIPYINPSPSYMEQILRRARAVGGADVTVQIWVPGPNGGQVVSAQVTFDGNSATLGLGGVNVEIGTDEEGRLLSAEVPAQGLVIERQ